MHPLLQLMRLDKPIGIWLLFFPAAWAVLLAAPDSNPVPLLLLMLVGATVTRAAGCILNDLADRRLDAQVARTRARPLAAGALRAWHAFFLLAVLLVIALLIALSLPRTVFLIALLALPMIAAYPWMKRITWWPQLFLGLTFNLSALMGWAATGAPLTLPAYLLYAASACWTLGYDTLYAIQDMTDDARIGIRSSARALGRSRIAPFVAVCYAAMFLLLAAVGILTGKGGVYYLSLAFASFLAYRQVRSARSGGHGGVLFNNNQWVGLSVMAGLLVPFFL